MTTLGIHYLQEQKLYFRHPKVQCNLEGRPAQEAVGRRQAMQSRSQDREQFWSDRAARWRPFPESVGICVWVSQSETKAQSCSITITNLLPIRRYDFWSSSTGLPYEARISKRKIYECVSIIIHFSLTNTYFIPTRYRVSVRFCEIKKQMWWELWWGHEDDRCRYICGTCMFSIWTL